MRKIEDENVKIINIIPSESLGRVLNFDNNLIQRNLKMCDAMHTIRGLKGNKYYIEPATDDNLLFSSLLSIPHEVINEIGKIMGFSQMEPKRALFEKILPGLSYMLEIPADCSYQDIIIGVLEYIAEERHVERYKVRNFNDFIEKIKHMICKENGTSNPFTSGITGITKLASMLSKDIVLKKVREELINVLKIA